MFALFVVLTILAAILMIGVVLIQKSKGGGLSSSFAGSNQIMGVRRTNNFIEKVTWYLAGAIALFAVLSSYTMGSAIQTGPRTKAAPAANVENTNYDAEAPATTEAPAATETTEAAQTEANTEAPAVSADTTVTE